MLGLAAGSAGTAKRLLGLGSDRGTSRREESHGTASETGAGEAYEAGDVYACPCGWKPSLQTGTNPKKNGQQREKEALQHWKDCQGEKPPKISADQSRGIAAHAHAAARKVKACAAISGFRQWHAKLKTKAPKVANAACQPDFETPFHRARKTAGAQRSYACTRCGKAPIPDFKRAPRRKRPKDVTMRSSSRPRSAKQLTKRES